MLREATNAELCAYLRELIAPRRGELEQITFKRGTRDRMDALCALMVSVYGGSTFETQDGELAYWDEPAKRWLMTDEKRLMQAQTRVLQEAGIGMTDADGARNRPFSGFMERQSFSDARLVAFANCILNMDDFSMHEPSPELRPRLRLNYDWDPVRGCKRWRRFLAEVMPSEQMRDALQEFMGMCFIDRSRVQIEKFCIFYGTGANGKSVVMNVMRGVLGEENVSDLSPDQLRQDKMVASVAGKLLNFAPDVKNKMAFGPELKPLISAQTVTGWNLYKGAVSVICPPLIFSINEQPRYTDLSDGFWRRLFFFDFYRTIPEREQDPYLASSIVREEAPGVLKWILEGRKRLLRNGGSFTESQTMKQRVRIERLRARGADTGPVAKWMEMNHWHVNPRDANNPPQLVSQELIYNALGGTVSRTAITREMREMRVGDDRGRVKSYWLYRYKGDKDKENERIK